MTCNFRYEQVKDLEKEVFWGMWMGSEQSLGSLTWKKEAGELESKKQK